MVLLYCVFSSSISGGNRTKQAVKKKSLTNQTHSDFNFKNMSDYHRGVCTVNMVSPSIDGDDEHFEKSQDDVTPSSLDYKFELCQRSQLRRNTDFSQASQDLKKFLAEKP